jgi:hypothetical protein
MTAQEIEGVGDNYCLLFSGFQPQNTYLRRVHYRNLEICSVQLRPRQSQLGVPLEHGQGWQVRHLDFQPSELYNQVSLVSGRSIDPLACEWYSMS